MGALTQSSKQMVGWLVVGVLLHELPLKRGLKYGLSKVVGSRKPEFKPDQLVDFDEASSNTLHNSRLFGKRRQWKAKPLNLRSKHVLYETS
jgi:hypothetical protein